MDLTPPISLMVQYDINKMEMVGIEPTSTRSQRMILAIVLQMPLLFTNKGMHDFLNASPSWLDDSRLLSNFCFTPEIGRGERLIRESNPYLIRDRDAYCHCSDHSRE